jgi:hypothetical protein
MPSAVPTARQVAPGSRNPSTFCSIGEYARGDAVCTGLASRLWNLSHADWREIPRAAPVALPSDSHHCRDCLLQRVRHRPARKVIVVELVTTTLVVLDCRNLSPGPPDE